jgi:segregation and condensation protein A
MAYNPLAVTVPAPLDTTAVLGYQLRLPTFEGPLDVLLRLIERSQLQITDVSLVTVTDQFLAYIESLDQAEPELIADFTNVATRLVLLKSRSLLPRPPLADDEEEASDLARELIEYRAVKTAAQTLAERDRRGEGAFARAQGGIAAPAATSPPRLAAHEALWLARALRRRLTTIPSPRVIMHTRPMISLREMVERVLHGVTERPQASFSGIARQCRDAHELRTAFLAVLVLIRRRVIDAEQEVPFGEITMSRVTGGFRPSLDDGVVFSADD